MLTGERSGIFGIDADEKDGKDGIAQLEELFDEHGMSWKRIVRSRTPSGGRHLFFRWDDRLADARNLGCVLTNKAGSRPRHGLEVKLRNTLLTLPPSDYGSGPYRWVRGRSPFDIAVPEAPEWLIELILNPPVDRRRMASLRRRSRGRCDRRPDRWLAQNARDTLRRIAGLSIGEQRNGANRLVFGFAARQGRGAQTMPAISCAPCWRWRRTAGAARGRRARPRSWWPTRWMQGASGMADDRRPRLSVVGGNPNIKRRQPEPPDEENEPFHGSLFDIALTHEPDHKVGDELIYGLLPTKQLVMLYGKPGCGKSTVACAMAHALANGDDFLGLKTQRVGVLYLAAERADAVKRVIAAMDERAKVTTTGLAIAKTKGLNLLEQREAFAQEVKSARQYIRTETGRRCKLLILDTLSAAAPDTDEAAQDFKEVVAMLRDLAEQCSMTVLVIHHEGKDAPAWPAWQRRA